MEHVPCGKTKKSENQSKCKMSKSKQKHITNQISTAEHKGYDNWLVTTKACVDNQFHKQKILFFFLEDHSFPYWNGHFISPKLPLARMEVKCPSLYAGTVDNHEIIKLNIATQPPLNDYGFLLHSKPHCLWLRQSKIQRGRGIKSSILPEKWP